MIIHVVKKGDSIYSVANRYGVEPRRIIEENGVTHPDELVIGQTLIITYPDQTYTVRQGDTLYSIAMAYHTDVSRLLQLNPSVRDVEHIIPGQQLVISFEGETFGAISTNGYAYPFVNKDNLRRTMPYLTYLSIFSYGFTENGDLIPIEDDELIKMCPEYEVTPVMVLSTLDETDTFNNQLAHNMFHNPEVENRLIDNVIANMRKKGYTALDVDFEYLLPEDKDAYTEFLTKLRNRLNPLGFELSTALAPKTSSEDKGLLYEAHDYEAIGKIANRILLMTYEWGYT